MQVATTASDGGGRLPCDALQIVFSFLIEIDVPGDAAASARLVCREWNEAYMRIPTAGLSYDTVQTETDARFRLRLTERHQRKYDGIRKPCKKQRFRTKWFFRITRKPTIRTPREGPRLPYAQVRREIIETEFKNMMTRATQPTRWIDDDELDTVEERQRVEERVRDVHQWHEVCIMDLEETQQKHATRRAQAPQKEASKHAARKYWATHRVDLEARYGEAFAIVFQWKKLACQRMARGYHHEVEVPEVPFKRAQWEACAAASLKTCVFRAFANTIEPEVDVILERHYQQRLHDRAMLSSIIESCHVFYTNKWITDAYQYLANAGTALNEMHQTSEFFTKAMKDDCSAFFNVNYAVRLLDLRLESSRHYRTLETRPFRVCRRYKQDPTTHHLMHSILHIRFLMSLNYERMLELKPKADIMLLAAFHGVFSTREHLWTRAGDGSYVIRITTVYAALKGQDLDTDSLPQDKRLALGKCVRKYIEEHHIPNADTKVKLTTLSPDGKSSTFMAYAYREEHILALIKACNKFINQ
jgi:hypothetical protein